MMTYIPHYKPNREIFKIGTKKMIALIHCCILNQLNTCSAVIFRGIISGTGTTSLLSQNCGCWFGKNAKIDRSSGSISHPNWQLCWRQWIIFLVTRFELCCGDRISIAQYGAISTSSTGSPLSSNWICAHNSTAISGTIDRPPKVHRNSGNA